MTLRRLSHGVFLAQDRALPEVRASQGQARLPQLKGLHHRLCPDDPPGLGRGTAVSGRHRCLHPQASRAGEAPTPRACPTASW